MSKSDYIPVYVTGEKKKHPQHVLAIDNAFFNKHTVDTTAPSGLRNPFANQLNRFNYDAFIEQVQSYLVLREREYLDESKDLLGERPKNPDGSQKKGSPYYRQVLPYIVARQLQPDGSYIYYRYRRTKTTGESRIALKGSIGYGGHVDLEDIVSKKSVINLLETLILATLREMNEEFYLVDGYGVKLLIEDHDLVKPSNLFIVDDTTSVEELHVAIVMYLDVPFGYKLVPNEDDQLKELPPATLAEMLADTSFDPEVWTGLLLDYFQAEQTDVLENRVTVGIDHGGETVAEVSVENYERVALEVKLDANDPDPAATVEAIMASTEKEALNMGRSGIYPIEGTPPELAALQKAAANAYHHGAGHFELDAKQTSN
jgi:predicted NUDIX family phosphoesterase